mgnify:CR=1 FL=1
MPIAPVKLPSEPPPALPVVQNVDAQVHDSIESIAEALVRQLYLPVRWTGCVQALQSAGATTLAECGPGKVLAGMVKRIDAELVTGCVLDPASLAEVKALLA